MVRELVGNDEFVEIFVDTPLAECIARDPKGLYRRALAGEIRNFTGVGSPYEPPQHPDLRLKASARAADLLAQDVLDELFRRGII
jgi:bifunctional enzyme CysN/CysC